MIALESVSSPRPSALESAPAVAARLLTPGGAGEPSEPSRSLRFLAGKGRSEAAPRPRTVGALESIIGPTDDRVRILDTELAPWRMVCALRMRGRSGAGLVGTGWFVGPRTVLTAGHCVHHEALLGGWATSIEVSPGRNGTELPFGSVRSNAFSSVDRWVSGADPDFDVGCIHLAEPLGERVGWFAVAALPPAELQGYLVNVSGYPLDRGNGTEQWYHRNTVLHVTDRRVFYATDSTGGQSGAPVWIHESDGGPPIAIAIHAYGAGASPAGLEANSAPRIVPEVLERIRGWVEGDGGWPKAP